MNGDEGCTSDSPFLFNLWQKEIKLEDEKENKKRAEYSLQVVSQVLLLL